MAWFKRLNNNLVRSNAALSFGVDGSGKQVVIGSQVQLTRGTGGLDTNFGNGSLSGYGKGSIVFLTAGGIKIVDSDGYWQTPTITTASPSVSPSSSASASNSPSPSRSVSPSASVSPSSSASRSASASVSPSASASPSA